MIKAILKIGFFVAVIFLAACSGDSNPGYEFMPNMYIKWPRKLRITVFFTLRKSFIPTLL